jgi:hypothetical protein
MKLLPFTTGKVFGTSVMIALNDMPFVRFMGPMDLTEESVIGVPIPSVAGAIDGDTSKS